MGNHRNYSNELLATLSTEIETTLWVERRPREGTLPVYWLLD